MTRPGLSWHMHSRLALHGVQAPRAARLLSRLLVALLVALLVVLVFTPCQMNCRGAGGFFAFHPY